MASDAGTEPGQAPRKTLEDIRREIDAEYPPFRTDDPLGEPGAVPGPHTSPDLDENDNSRERPHETGVEPHRPLPSGGAGRRGYVIAAAVGCIAGQVLLVVAYVAVTQVARDVLLPRGSARTLGLSGDDTAARAATALAQLQREPSPTVPRAAPAPGTDPQLEALRTDLRSFAVKLERAESRVTSAESRVGGVESRVNGVEASVRRLGDGASAAAWQRQVENTPFASRLIASKPSPPAPLPPARRSVPATDSERWISSENVAPPSPALPRQVRPLVEPAALSELSAGPPQRRTESSGSSEGGAPTTHSAPIRAGRAPSDSALSSKTLPSLMDKLRHDWRTIKYGFTKAGKDIKEAMRDFGRKVEGD